MKKLFIAALLGLSAMTLLSGCLNIKLGGGSTSTPVLPTVGQQLIDLQRAKDTGAITEAEYQAEKTRLLGHK